MGKCLGCYGYGNQTVIYHSKNCHFSQ